MTNGERGNWRWELNRVLGFREQFANYKMLRFVRKTLFSLVSHTVHEFYGLKASQMKKVRASSHEYSCEQKLMSSLAYIISNWFVLLGKKSEFSK